MVLTAEGIAKLATSSSTIGLAKHLLQVSIYQLYALAIGIASYS